LQTTRHRRRCTNTQRPQTPSTRPQHALTPLTPPPQVDAALALLREALAAEVALQAELMGIQGALEPILAAGLAAAAPAGGR